MRNVKLIVLIASSLIIFVIAIKVLSLGFSEPALIKPEMSGNEPEKRGAPPYELVTDRGGVLFHIKVFFWVPANSSCYKAFADTGIKTYILGHGIIDNWPVMETYKKSGDKKLVYVYVPKTFALYYGKQFYNFVHVYYER